MSELEDISFSLDLCVLAIESAKNDITDASYKARNGRFIQVNAVAVKSLVEDVTIGPVLINTKNIKYVWEGEQRHSHALVHLGADNTGCTIEMDCGAKFRLSDEINYINNLLMGLD